MNRQMKNQDDDLDWEHVHPLILPNEEKPKRKYEDILMDAIGFTEDELELNRVGQLSKDQWRILYLRQNIWLIAIILVGFVLLALWLGISFSIPHVIAITGILYCANKWLMFHNDLRQPRAISMEGRISLDVYGKGSYTLAVENERFIVNKNIFLAFKNGDPYRIYYTPYTKHLLSAEWLRD